MNFSETEPFYIQRQNFFFGVSFNFKGLNPDTESLFQNIIKSLGGSVNESFKSLTISTPSYARKNKNKKCYSSKFILDSVNSRKVLNPEYYRHEVNEFCCVDAQYIFRTNSCKSYQDNKCQNCRDLELRDLEFDNSNNEILTSRNHDSPDFKPSLHISNISQENNSSCEIPSSLNLDNSEFTNGEKQPELEVDNLNSETPDSLDLVSFQNLNSNKNKSIEKPLKTLNSKLINNGASTSREPKRIEKKCDKPKWINYGASTSKKSQKKEKDTDKSQNLIKKFLQSSKSSNDSDSDSEITSKSKNVNKKKQKNEALTSTVNQGDSSEFEISFSDCSLVEYSGNEENHEETENGWWSYLPKPQKLTNTSSKNNFISTKRGKTFTIDEKKLMIAYLVVKKSVHLAASRKIYVAMHSDGYLVHRSVESMNNNMRRVILPNIAKFHLPSHIEQEFIEVTKK